MTSVVGADVTPDFLGRLSCTELVTGVYPRPPVTPKVREWYVSESRSRVW